MLGWGADGGEHGPAATGRSVALALARDRDEQGGNENARVPELASKSSSFSSGSRGLVLLLLGLDPLVFRYLAECWFRALSAPAAAWRSGPMGSVFGWLGDYKKERACMPIPPLTPGAARATKKVLGGIPPPRGAGAVAQPCLP